MISSAVLVIILSCLNLETEAQLFGDEFIQPNKNPIVFDSITNLSGGGGFKHEEYSFEWWIDMTVSFWCLIIAGAMAGLIVGLASIDHLTLEIARKKNKKMEKSVNTIFAVVN
jgi:hypothetical protein